MFTQTYNHRAVLLMMLPYSNVKVANDKALNIKYSASFPTLWEIVTENVTVKCMKVKG